MYTTQISRKGFLRAALPKNLVGVFNGPLPPRGPHQAYALFDRIHWPLPEPVVSLFKIEAKVQSEAYLPQLASAHVSILGEKLGPRGVAKAVHITQGWNYMPYACTRHLLVAHAVAIMDLPYYHNWWIDASFSGCLVLIPGHRDPDRRIFPHLPVYLKPGADIEATIGHLLKNDLLFKLTFAQQQHISWKLLKILGRGYKRHGP